MANHWFEKFPRSVMLVVCLGLQVHIGGLILGCVGVEAINPGFGYNVRHQQSDGL